MRSSYEGRVARVAASRSWPVCSSAITRTRARKDFAISADGILRSWAKIEAELARCVLRCANCHRETHAGLRSFTADQAVGEAMTRYRIEIQRRVA